MSKSLETAHCSGIILGADHKHTVFLGDGKALETADNGYVSIGQTHDVVFCIVEKRLAVYCDVVASINLDVGRRVGGVAAYRVYGIGEHTLPAA